jgi:predicted cobalt transporter CbtA
VKGSESVLAAVIADIVAAMLFALVQSVLLTPLILGGETY